MRFVLADLKDSSGSVSKDTVAGGYGARFHSFSKVTRVYHHFKAQYGDVPSVQLAYVAAILARFGHDVAFTRDPGEVPDGDVAIVLSSLVDYRQETAWADRARARGMRVGFVGLAASKMPQLFADHADFVIDGEPETAIGRLARGEALQGACKSEAVDDLDSLPFPRWDLVGRRRNPLGIQLSARPAGGGFPVMASRSCPEHCTYCPHRILTTYRTRSVANVADEIEQLADRVRRPHIIFRDPLFTEKRDRILELCDAIQARNLSITFECETRLDRLDFDLIDRMHAAGLRAMSFGVESVSPTTLKKVGRRPIPPDHVRQIIDYCRSAGVLTFAFYVFGFLTDDWQSIAATIDYAIATGSTMAQFKILTPYPGTPLWKQMEPLVHEKDWEKFDGYTPTFRHPNLTDRELMFLLGAAYTRFYMRPSYLTNLLKVHNHSVREWAHRMDGHVLARYSRREIELMSRPVAC
jgi:anaerobic magnesium-protoporphyrin IX monomethyl ester cyclase